MPLSSKYIGEKCKNIKMMDSQLRCRRVWVISVCKTNSPLFALCMARQHEEKVVKFMLISILVNLLYSYIKVNVYTKVFDYGQPLINIKKTTGSLSFYGGHKM